MQRFGNLKKHFLWTHKKEILLYICIFVAVLGTIKITSTIIDHKSFESTEVVQAWLPNCYRVFIDGSDIGLVADREDGEIAIKQALNNLISELGYDPEVTPQIRYYEEYSSSEDAATLGTLVPTMQKVIKDGIDVIKVKAYAMKIGDDFVVALDSEEAVKQVLQNAQNIYVSGESQFAVALEVNPNNSLVTSPNIVAIQATLAKNKSLATAPLVQAAVTDSTTEDNSQAITDPVNQGKTVDVKFTEDVMIVETFVDSNKILSVEDATELITKENQEPTKYVVKEGDCSSTIAVSNNMSMQTLYDLNAGLDENSVLHVGDDIIVMVPEPELSITTQEEVVYPIPIERETTYVENDSKYVGSNTVIDDGSDGVKQITATLTKLNGKETERVITKEEVITEPVDKVVEKGSKPLPAKGATGNFIYPVVHYTLTSTFGYRWGGFHYGVDLAAPTGTAIRAADGGVVIEAGWRTSYGLCITIDHGDGTTTRYGHCSQLEVSVGQQVSQYEEIAKVGSTGNSTGPHCHFEIRFDGTPVNPLNYLSR